MSEAYKVRVGDAEFSKNISELFDKDRDLYELRIGPEHVLISEKHPEGALDPDRKAGGSFGWRMGSYISPQSSRT